MSVSLVIDELILTITDTYRSVLDKEDCVTIKRDSYTSLYIQSTHMKSTVAASIWSLPEVYAPAMTYPPSYH